MHFKSYVAKGVESVYRCYSEIIESRTTYTDIYEYLNALAEELAEAYLQESSCAHNELTNWMPGFAKTSRADIIGQNFSLKDMRKVIARSHGFKSWKKVDKKGERTFDDNFEAAVDCIQTGNISALESLLGMHPDLVNNRSPFGHRATLLHYCATNGVETYHQKLPLNMPEIARLLIERGADKNKTSKAYSGKFTPAELVGTSGHPTAAGIMNKLLGVLA